MTRQLTIVNLSNWEDEDYVIINDDKSVQLKPGEFLDIGIYKPTEFTVRPVSPSAPKPAKAFGRQVSANMKVTIEPFRDTKEPFRKHLTSMNKE